MTRRSHRSHLLDIYSTWLHVATNAREWASVCSEVASLDEAVPESMGMTSFNVFEPDNGGRHVPHLVVFIDVTAHVDNAAGLVETCAHEAAHAANLLMGYLEAQIRDLDEPHAYLVGWIAQWLWKACT